MKNLYLIIGASGSGKTTLERNLCNFYNARAVRSFTTRPPRRDGDTDHYFLTDKEFDALGELVAFTEYNGYRYGVTKDILDKADFYVIDPEGAKYLLQRYTERPVCVIWLEAGVTKRALRMREQGRSEKDILDRTRLDAYAFSPSRFYEVADLIPKKERMALVFADGSKDQVLMDAAAVIDTME